MGNEGKGGSVGQRRHSVEFKVEIAERMLAGESVSALAGRHGLPRSMMYRWRDAYRREGRDGLARRRGRPPGSGKRSGGGSEEEKLRRRVAELERLVGQQAVELAFFRGVFERVNARRRIEGRGGEASTPKSDG